MELKSQARKALGSALTKSTWRFRFRSYRALNTAKDQWDSQYGAGHWEGLRRVGEIPRYSVIAGYCRHFKPSGSILDVGCGEGLLQTTLHEYSRYLGIDLSDEAIRLASKRRDDITLFVQGDATSCHVDGLFDVVVFNECLYYFKDPMSVMSRYHRVLKAGGLLIVSNYVTGLDRLIWHMIDAEYSAIASVKVVNDERISWNVKVLARRDSGPHQRATHRD
jgi:2-polyprenyl-3-methyl-5-hydroxy-6-metoxy-1,4-benzoquinol methylase